MIDTWWNCYNGGWGDELVPEAFAHPAKFSRGLIRRIYKHAIDENWIGEGSLIIDPFGGVGLGGIDSARYGIMWMGVELESRFTSLARQNFLHLAEKEWCTCGKENQTYLRELRRGVSEGIQRSQPNQKIEDGAILQPGLLQYIPVQGEKIVGREQGEVNRKNSLEQGQAVVKEDERETIALVQWGQQGFGKKRELERRALYQLDGICGNQSGREAEAGAYVSNGTEDRPQDIPQRGSTSYQWEQDGQSNRKLEVDDNIRAHETSSSQRREANKRRKENKFCPICGKLIVPFPLILQGDSRNLLSVVEAGRAAACVSSPPFAGNTGGHGESSQNAIDIALFKRHLGSMVGVNVTPGNLGNLRPGDFDAAVGSPPYQEQVIRDRDIGKPGFMQGATQGRHSFDAYGHAPGQLGSMLPGDFAGAVGADGVVSSPPYSETHIGDNALSVDHSRWGTGADLCTGSGENYGHSEGQIGRTSGDTFWAAARVIVAQTYAALRPGGHAIFVTKRFCRAGAIVDFSQQWAQLCQSCGFTLVHWHKAMLTEEAEQIRFDGSSKRKKRVSFFRRLHEKKRPDLAIDWEDVLCFAKECDAGERTGGDFDA